jgi:hypothetical protein
MTFLYLFPTRRLEWLIALMTTYLGGFTLLPFKSFAEAYFVGPMSWATEMLWGIGYLVIGIFHCVALRIDVKAWWTPFLRAAMLFLNAQLYFAAGLALAMQNPWSVGAQVHFFLSFGFCGVAFRTAMADCATEWVMMSATRAARKRGQA